MRETLLTAVNVMSIWHSLGKWHAWKIGESLKAFTHIDYLMWLLMSAPVVNVCDKPDLDYADIVIGYAPCVSGSYSFLCLTTLPLSISSTLMEMESTVSSGRSTPAMMNGQSSASSSGAKNVAYSCSWDLCLQYFNSSPDLAEHIRGIHVDGQRGGVSICF